jgi:hypothetical protein
VARLGRRTEQGVLDLLEQRQRRVALERLRKRRGARLADLVVPQAAARREGLGMLVARQGRRNRAGRETYTRDVSVALLFSASDSAAAPASPIGLPTRLQRKRRVRDARGETWPPSQSRARATYLSDVSKLNPFARLSLFLLLLSS